MNLNNDVCHQIKANWSLNTVYNPLVSPFLNSGAILAAFESSGIFLAKDDSKMMVIVSTISSFASFNNHG